MGNKLNSIEVIKSYIVKTDGQSYIGYIDLDNFSQFNQLNGYEGGNSFLEKFKSLLEDKSYKTELLNSIGDEFIVGINCSSDSIKETTISLLRNTFEFSKVTFSIGLVDCRNGYSAKAVIEKAMQSMLIAKKHGKNKICII